MSTIPLYDPSAGPYASHRVVAPGGYERWMFVGWNAEKSQLLQVVFATGESSGTELADDYRNFRRSPTRSIPPIPKNYSVVTARLIEGSSVMKSAAFRFEARDWKTSGARIQAGNHLLSHQSDGWHISIAGESLTVHCSPKNSSACAETCLAKFSEGAHLAWNDPAVYFVTAKWGDELFQGEGFSLHRLGTEPDWHRFDSTMRVGCAVIENRVSVVAVIAMVNPSGRSVIARCWTGSAWDDLHSQDAFMEMRFADGVVLSHVMTTDASDRMHRLSRYSVKRGEDQGWAILEEMS